jgi:hypothetical protein
MKSKAKRKSRLPVLMAFVACVFLAYPAWYLFVRPGRETSQNDQPPSRIEKSAIEKLRSLPYVDWAPMDKEGLGKKGVTIYDPKLTFNGVNIYNSEVSSGGLLLDMQGRIIHTFVDKREQRGRWKLIEPYQNDLLLVLAVDERAIFMMDWDSNVKWVRQMLFHHDLAVADNGDIYAIMDRKRSAPSYSQNELIVDNALVILTKDGNIKKEISLAKMVAQHKSLLYAAKNQRKKQYIYHKDAWDVFHTNTLEIIDRDVAYGPNKMFKKGQVIFCVRHFDIIGVIDIEKEEIVWAWGLGQLDYPHHPSLLENGNILIFDNGNFRRYSRVIELNPATNKIEWEYKADPLPSFYSPSRGSAQRLPNGNTLITESDRGRVFEVTRDGKIVWEFYTHEIDTRKNKRATIYRMMRITEPEKFPRLKIKQR